MRRDENIPFYYRIWATLGSRLRDGIYAPGEILPSVQELAKEFSVSDITIKKAISSLVEEGYLERKRGVGTWVRKEMINKVKMPLSAPNFWDWFDDRDHIKDREFRVLSISTIPVNANVKSKLGVQPGKLSCLKRIMKVRGEVVSYFTNCFYDTFLDPTLFEPDRYNNQRFLKIAIENWKEEIVKVQQQVRVTVADLDLAKILMIGFGDALFHVENVYYGKNNNPLAITQMYHRGDVYTYEGTTDFDKKVITRRQEDPANVKLSFSDIKGVQIKKPKRRKQKKEKINGAGK